VKRSATLSGDQEPKHRAAVQRSTARRQHHKHAWRITEVDFQQHCVLRRYDCECGAVDYTTG